MLVGWTSIRITPNFKRLYDGGFYAQSFFKTAIAKPVLYEEVFFNSAMRGKAEQ